MTKYTIKDDATHGQILVKNGKDAVCPLQQPIPTQSQMGGVMLLRLPCSTNCPFAELLKYKTPEGNINEYNISCTGSLITLEVETEENTLKLI